MKEVNYTVTMTGDEWGLQGRHVLHTLEVSWLEQGAINAELDSAALNLVAQAWYLKQQTDPELALSRARKRSSIRLVRSEHSSEQC